MTPAGCDILPPSPDACAKAAAALAGGELVAFATETVYGLGADALNEQAVARIFEAKGRPRFDPLITHLADPADVWPLVDAPAAVLARARALAERFWPGPLTLVLPKRAGVVPDLVTAGLPTVAVRVPAHPVARDLLKAAHAAGVRGIAAPSANRFGGISPTRAEHVASELGRTGLVRFVLDGGPCTHGVESTVVSLCDDPPRVLRFGGLEVDALEEALGTVHLPDGHAPTDAEARQGLASPGMTARHYAPRTPLVAVPLGAGSEPSELGSALEAAAGHASRLALLTFDNGQMQAWRAAFPSGRELVSAIALSPGGNLREAATHLFAAMRELDASGAERILAGPVPQEGLGLAIGDRLRRASQRG